MKRTLCFSLVILFGFLSKAQNKDNTEEKGYIKSIEQKRQNKDESYLEDENSPIKAEDKENFKGLQYFPPSLTYRIKARFVKVKKGEVLQMKTSTTRIAYYRKYAEVHFTIEKRSFTLSIYQDDKLKKQKGFEKYLFLPFRDLTSGKESYGGGRYLDLQIPDGNSIILDFNDTYNPLCAYNENYSCPIPPKENTLEIEIKAGEKIFKEH